MATAPPEPFTPRGAAAAPRVLVIVPALDEADSLPDTLDALHAAAPRVDVLVVDDGSHDATAAVARSRGVTVVRHALNLGVGAALQTGFRYAVERGYEIGRAHV